MPDRFALLANGFVVLGIFAIEGPLTLLAANIEKELRQLQMLFLLPAKPVACSFRRSSYKRK